MSLKSIAAAALVVFMASAPAPAQQAVRDLAELAPAAPAELAADVLLKLIERGYITDLKWKREVLDTAWSLAPRAAFALEIEPAVTAAGTTDSHAGSLSAALATGLSTAGIQARVIAQMVKLDPHETRKMFLQMSPPAAESPDCLADHYTTHRAYFQALTATLPTFSVEETKNGEEFKFLAEALRALTNPEDFELSRQLLQTDQGLTNEESATLMTLWSEKLAEARFTDRLFSSRSIDAIATPVIFGLKQAQLRGISMEREFRALRAYLVNHARAARCGESRSQAVDEESARAAFNRFIGVLMPNIPAIVPEEIAAAGFGEMAKVALYASNENEKIREMKSDYAHLRFGSEEREAVNEYLTIQERSTPEWNDEALRFLNKLQRWTKEFGQSNREILFQKAQWYGALVYAAPEGKLRELFLDDYVKYLISSPVERESPAEWVMWLNRLIGAADIPDRGAWLDQIERAGDSTVAVYCQFARLRL